MQTPTHAPVPCFVCDAGGSIPFFEMEDVPVHVGLQWPTREQARHCPRGTINLCYCPRCGHVYNAAFDPALMHYSEDYDNSLYYSPRFQEYSREVAQHLIERYELREKDIIEIGCGKGDFLLLLARLGNNRAVGFDPSYQPERVDAEAARRVTFIQDFYSERYIEFQADLICSRYVFEHVPNPIDFLAMVRRSAGQTRPVVYFEVPNVFLILHNLSVWDVIYEHCSYFSPSSLAFVFDRCGFEVRDLYEGYGGQHLGIEALPRTGPSTVSGAAWGDASAMEPSVHAFQQCFQHARSKWTQRLALARTSGQRVVLWGAGAKATGFLNMLDVNNEMVEYVVDVNPHKHGAFMAGTGQEIVPPAFLKTYQPDIVLAMNPIYRQEIEGELYDMGLAPELLFAS